MVESAGRWPNLAFINLAGELEKLGFECEGRLRRFFVLRGEPVDNYLYALLAEDWRTGDSRWPPHVGT